MVQAKLSSITKFKISAYMALSLSEGNCKNFYNEVFRIIVFNCNLCLYTKKNGIKYPAICPMELTTGTQFMIHVNAYMCMSKYTVYMYMLNQATGLIK